MKTRLLVVEDDPDLGQLVLDVARSSAMEASLVPSAEAAVQELSRGGWDIVVTDIRLTGADGIELVRWIRAHDPRIAVVAMTGFGTLETAVEAVRSGAFDYVEKPFEPERLLLALERAREAHGLRHEVSTLRSELSEHTAVAEIVAESRVMRDVLSIVARVADQQLPVVVSGPSGSGKELVARALHKRSQRAARAFVAINCAAIPDGLLESELFGVKKGAFTDARADRVGLLREADGGTLFLDEVGELPPALQAKLLRVLQDGEVRAVGGSTSTRVDVRVVAATNRDLRKAVADGTFREDLFYRLAVLEISIPPLVDRPEDILPLAEAFLRRAAERAGRKVTLSRVAADRLLEHTWPGNARELRNAMERAVALSASDVLSPEDLPGPAPREASSTFLKEAADRQMTLDELSRMYAQLVLSRVGGARKRAAQILGVDRRTLLRWFGPADES